MNGAGSTTHSPNLRSTSLTTSLGILAILLSLAMGVSGCGGSTDGQSETAKSLKAPKFPTGSSMERIQQAGKLIVGVSFDKPGFGFRNPSTGVVSGLDTEIAKLMAQRIFGGTEEEAAKKIEYVETIPKNREVFLTQGRVDVVIAGYALDANNTAADFAGPYYTAHGDLLVKASNNDALNSKAVCALTDSTYATDVKKKAAQAEVKTKATYPDCITALTKDEVTAVAGDDAVLASNAGSSGGTLKLANAPFSDQPYGIGVKKGDSALVLFLNEQLRKVIKNGDWQRAFDATVKQIGVPSQPVPTIPAAQGK